MSSFNLDQWARQLAAAVPEGLRSAKQDLEKNFHGLLQAGLNRMDLVTREEFDVQAAVLQRTRDKLAELEARVQEPERPVGTG